MAMMGCRGMVRSPKTRCGHWRSIAVKVYKRGSIYPDLESSQHRNSEWVGDGRGQRYEPARKLSWRAIPLRKHSRKEISFRYLNNRIDRRGGFFKSTGRSRFN